MGRLDEITIDELHEKLAQTEGNKATQRVLAAIGRKQGATLNELAERHNVAEKTIRNWLDRFAEQPLSDAPYDENRSGRPTKLSNSEQQELFEQLHQSPSEFGYDREVWFPELVHQHIKEKFGVEFSIRHVYRLMDEAGLSYRTARSRHYQADPEKEAEFRDTVQKNSSDR
jgi:transposase